MRPSPRSRFAVELLEDRLAPATFTVTNVDDAGAGSLRAALTAANATPTADAIAFNIPGPSPYLFDLLAPLPTITAKVKIDGGTQPGTTTLPLIVLNGAAAGGNGLSINATAAGTIVRFLTIHHFAGDGIRIRASNCRVEACLIGADSSGAIAAPNGSNGIHILAGADNNLIGGAAAGTGNVISGNTGAGVRIGGAGTTGNRVVNNAIGLEFGGTSGLGNGIGVWISGGASGNVVGGSAGNSIAGNSSVGIAVTGPTTSGNRIANNRIGVDDTGTVAIPNNGDGVFIGDSARRTVVAGNVISGNAGNGVVISGGFETIVRGNTIGLARDGDTELANERTGVRIADGARNNTVGGAAPAHGNLIGGNELYGVEILGAGTNRNAVLGNRIGTDAAATADRGNLVGVRIALGAKNNVVGGTVAGSRNIISGNDTGIAIVDPGTTGQRVQGNFIGVDATGGARLPNGFGIHVFAGAGHNLIGGTVAAARNIISGNSIQGVELTGQGTTGNRIEGNFIGTDATGTFLFDQRGVGVIASNGASGNVIGGRVAGARNLISGNRFGVVLTGLLTAANRVEGNFIGTDRHGTGKIGNVFGVAMSGGAEGNIVGGTAAGTRNVIAGNQDGIFITQAGTAFNRIEGNFIGLGASGAPLGNSQSGIEIIAGADGNIIGGATAGSGNVIAFNGADGVTIETGGAGNAILGNSIHVNGDLGIDLGASGATPNDATDPDTGANNLMNFPVLHTALIDGQVLFLSGSINTSGILPVRIEFFASPTGEGEGVLFLGSIQLQLNLFSFMPWSAAFSSALVQSGHFITATATDDVGNTSEFSLALEVL